jgi:hypothetical protein
VFICVHLWLSFWLVLFKPRKTRNVAKREGLLSRVLAFLAVQNNGWFFITAKDAKGAKEGNPEGRCFFSFIFSVLRVLRILRG